MVDFDDVEGELDFNNKYLKTTVVILLCVLVFLAGYQFCWYKNTKTSETAIDYIEEKILNFPNVEGVPVSKFNNKMSIIQFQQSYVQYRFFSRSLLKQYVDSVCGVNYKKVNLSGLPEIE